VKDVAGGGRIKGITVEIGGDTQGLDKALKGVNDTSRNLQAELRDVNKLLKFDPNNAELLAQKQKILADQVENTTKRLHTLQDAQDQVNAAFQAGDIGEAQYRAFQREVQATEGYLRSLEAQIEKVDDSNAPQNAAQDINKIERAADKAKGAIGAMGRGLGAAAKGISAGALGAAAGIGGLIAGTNDLSKELSRLNFNAFNEGFDTKGIENDFRRIAAITGETDSAVETMANLMQTGFDQQQMSEAVDLVNGAYLRFSDTLKTEGIADGIQETFATGAAVGPFAELLDRSGVNLDNFNAGLAEAAKQGKETDFVLQQMRDIGLAGTSEAYKEMNKDLIAQQEAQINLQMALAGLGQALMPLATIVMNFAAKMAEWATENINLISSFGSISEGITALLPQLFGKGLQMISTIVQAIVSSLPTIISSGMQILMSVIQGIIQMLPSLIAQIQTLLPMISNTLQQNLPMIINAGIDLILALVDGIIQLLPSLIDTALTLIVTIATALLNNLPRIVEAGVKLIIALVKGLLKALPDIDKALETIIRTMLDALKNTDQKLQQMGKDAIDGLIKGIKSKAKEVANAARDIASGIGDKIASILKLGSPSKVLISMGEDTGDGFWIGITRTIGKVQKAAGKMAASVSDSLSNVKYQSKQTGNWAENMISSIVGMLDTGGLNDELSKYFQAVVEDGDWLNDWLTHMPKQVHDYARQFGFILAKDLEGSNAFGWNERKAPNVTKPNMNVTINSPKQLDVREANLVWNKTLKQMQLQW
jgi:phage-related minor tail protein